MLLVERTSKLFFQTTKSQLNSFVPTNQKKMSSKSAIEKIIDDLKADNEKNYEKACDLYRQALEQFTIETDSKKPPEMPKERKGLAKKTHNEQNGPDKLAISTLSMKLKELENEHHNLRNLSVELKNLEYEHIKLKKETSEDSCFNLGLWGILVVFFMFFFYQLAIEKRLMTEYVNNKFLEFKK